MRKAMFWILAIGLTIWLTMIEAHKLAVAAVWPYLEWAWFYYVAF